MGYARVHRNQHIEAVFSVNEKLSVCKSCPTDARHRFDRMLWKVARQSPIKIFVEQYSQIRRAQERGLGKFRAAQLPDRVERWESLRESHLLTLQLRGDQKDFELVRAFH